PELLPVRGLQRPPDDRSAHARHPDPVAFDRGVEWRNKNACTQHSDKRSSVHHSMIWSARSRIGCGIVMPSALAAFMLITNSNLVGCSIGRSAGFAPLRILSTLDAARRPMYGRLAP